MPENRDKFTLEKMQINERLTKLELSHFDLRTDLKEYISNAMDNIAKLNNIIIGDGKNEGLVEDMRNLKKSETKRQKHYLFLYSGICGSFMVACVNFVWDKLTGK